MESGWTNAVDEGDVGGASRLDDINPDAIERVEILKCAAGALTVATMAGAYGLFQATLSSSGGERPRTDPNITLIPLSGMLGLLGIGR